MAQTNSRSKKNSTKKQKSSFRPPSYISNERMQTRSFTVRKLVDRSALTSSTSVDTLGSYAFRLTDLPEYASYTTIFDQYRFKRVELIFLPGTQPALPAATLQRAPSLYTAIDYDDNGTPASVATVLNYANCRLTPPGRKLVVSFKPHCAIGAYNGTNFSNYANSVNQWMDAASSDVYHYGVKTAMPSNNFISNWQVIAAYTIEFRNVR
jgi:hypothetical protein